MRKGNLFVISAASGTGKTSLVKALLSKLKQLSVSISHTTRPMRPGEENGINYFFVDKACFKQMIEQRAFIEYAQVFGNFYGTAYEQVQEKLELGKDVILEIDWQGAQQIRSVYPDSVTIFILPPSLQALKFRLEHRAQDSPEVIQNRLKLSCDEISHFKEFDYIVINDDFELALAELQAIIIAQRCYQKRNAKFFQDLVKQMVVI